MTNKINELTRPIADIHNRSAAEVFDMMCDRIVGFQLMRRLDAIMESISNTMTDAKVDYPAGREAGHRIEYEEAELRNEIHKILRSEDF